METPPRELALVFCVFFSVAVIFSSLLLAIYAKPSSPLFWPNLVTASVAALQGISAFCWLRGPLHVGATMGWAEIFAMWRAGRLPRRAARIWLTTTALLPLSFLMQALALAATADNGLLTVGALTLAGQAVLFLGVVTGLLVSGMQNRSILLQDI